MFTRLNDVGFCLKRGKCKFLLPSVEYLGHVINSEGFKPSEKKVRAILHAPAPKNISQLRSFLGLVNYYGRFIQSISVILAPLYLLLRNQTEWFWRTNQASSFEKVKELLVSSRVLVPDKELIVSSDASQYGIGEVLSHLMDDGSGRPIYYSSQPLAEAGKGYSQLDKEALAIIFGVKKFHHFLYGRLSSICSDHKPLQHIFGCGQPVPRMADF